MSRGLYVGATPSDPAYNRILAALHDHGSHVEEQRQGDALAQCPAHNDGKPSLHVTDGDDRALLWCFAGCDTDEILGTLGLTRDDLFNEKVTNYPYRDASGATVRTVTRHVGKQFRQSGQTKGEAPLYRIPEVLTAVREGRAVMLVEGEGDVHAWLRQGQEATTAPAGARNFDKADVTPLTGANVIAVVDRDEAGDAWARLVQDCLRGVVATLTFRRAKVGKDSSDHIAAGLGLEDLEPYLLPNPLLDGIRTGTWLDQQEFPPMQWVVPGLIPDGFGLITGPPKAGKSWLVLGLALSAAAGRAALGRLPLAGAKPILYLALEDSDRRMQSRTRVLMRDEATPEAFNYAIEAPPGATFPLIQSWLEQHEGQNPVVILDTLGKIMPNAKIGESQYQRDYRIGSAVKQLAQPGTSILIVHHTRKSESSDWMDSTSGTNGLNGAADFTLNLARERNSPNGLLRVTGRDVDEGEFGIVFDRGMWILDGRDLAQASANAELMQRQRKAKRHAVEEEAPQQQDDGVVTCFKHGLAYDPEIGCARCRMEG